MSRLESDAGRIATPLDGGNDKAWLRAQVIYRDEQTTDVEGMTWQQTQGQIVPNGGSMELIR